MNEFDKNQNQGAETGAQGDKPAFGQFDKEQGQDRQTEQGESRQEEFAGADTPDEGRARRSRAASAARNSPRRARRSTRASRSRARPRRAAARIRTTSSADAFPTDDMTRPRPAFRARPFAMAGFTFGPRPAILGP